MKSTFSTFLLTAFACILFLGPKYSLAVAAFQQPDPSMLKRLDAAGPPCSSQLDATRTSIAEHLMASVTEQLNNRLFHEQGRDCHGPHHPHRPHHSHCPHHSHRPHHSQCLPRLRCDANYDRGDDHNRDRNHGYGYDNRHRCYHQHHHACGRSYPHSHSCVDRLPKTRPHCPRPDPVFCIKPPGVLLASAPGAVRPLLPRPRQSPPYSHLKSINATHGKCVNDRTRRLYPRHPLPLYQHRPPTVTEKVAHTIATAASNIKSMLGLSARPCSVLHDDLNHTRQMAATRHQLRLLQAEARACPTREVMESALRTIDRLKKKLREARPCAAAVGSREYLQDQAENTALLRKLGQLTLEIHDINRNQLAPLIRGEGAIHNEQLAIIRDTLEQIDQLQERRHELELQHEMIMSSLAKERERIDEEARRHHQLEFEQQIQREHERMERAMLKRQRMEEEERTRQGLQRREQAERERQHRAEMERRERIERAARDEAQRRADEQHQYQHQHDHSQQSLYLPYPRPSHVFPPVYPPPYRPYPEPGSGMPLSPQELGMRAAHGMAHLAANRLRQLERRTGAVADKMATTQPDSAMSNIAEAAFSNVANNFQNLAHLPTHLPSFSRGTGKANHDFHVSTEAIPMDASQRLVMLNKNRFAATRMPIEKINKLRESLDLMLYAAFVPKPGTQYPPGYKEDGYLIDPRNGFIISEEKVDYFDVEKMNMLYNGNPNELLVQIGELRYRIIYERRERAIDVIKDKMQYAVFALVLDRPCGITNEGVSTKLHIRRVGATTPITYGGGKKIWVNGQQTNRLTNLRFNNSQRLLIADYLLDPRQSTQFVIPENMLSFFQEISGLPILNIAVVG